MAAMAEVTGIRYGSGRPDGLPGRLGLESKDPIEGIRASLAHVQRETVNVSAPGGIDSLASKSMTLLGKDSISGKDQIVIVASQISAKDQVDADKAEAALVRRGLNAIDAAAGLGKITWERAEEMKAEMKLARVGIVATVQNAMELGRASVPSEVVSRSNARPPESAQHTWVNPDVAPKRLSKKQLIRAGIITVGGFSLVGCSVFTPARPSVVPTEAVRVTATATEQAGAQTPVPEQRNISTIEAIGTAINDVTEVIKESDAFAKAQVSWYDQDGKVITKTGTESGLSLLGLLDVKAGGEQVTRFGLATSPGGVEHVVMKTSDGQWILLVGNDTQIVDPVTGHTFEAVGVYADRATRKIPVNEFTSEASVYYPVLSQEFDQSGKFVSGWYYDVVADQFHKIPKLEGGHGKLLTIVERGDQAVVTGTALMKTEGATDWNFGFLGDGRFGIRDAQGNALRAWDGSSWVEPRAEYKGAVLYSIEEAQQMIISEGSTNPEDNEFAQHVGEKLADVIMIRNPDTTDTDHPWIVSYKGIQERLVQQIQMKPFVMVDQWIENKLVIDGQKIDTTLFIVRTTESDHSIVVFKDKAGTYRVLVLDSIFWPQFEDNRQLLP